ncbi:hypothetical protein [Rickettsia montanensis]|uniref:hypothetical protein n=1 Tax=Rickettsia montanensis TaxID=33991 RepID=UPI00031BE115|nr:hypothetical protein [Rickettsia montanensis]
MAKTFVAEGDALVLLNQNEEAVDTYATVENIYWNNYKENMKNVYEISNMYFAVLVVLYLRNFGMKNSVIIR